MLREVPLLDDAREAEATCSGNHVGTEKSSDCASSKQRRFLGKKIELMISQILKNILSLINDMINILMINIYDIYDIYP